MKYKAAIFDMDGTIIDSMWIWRDLATNSFKKRGLIPPENLEHTIFSMNFMDAARYCIEQSGSDQTPEELVMEWTLDARKLYENDITLKPKAREFLTYLKSNGYIICLTTSNFMEIAIDILHRFSLTDLFDSITVTSEVSRGKSFPDVFLHTASKHNISPESCIVFEDSFYAVKGAKMAGMTVVGVYDEFAKELESEMRKLSDLYIYSFDEFDNGHSILE